MRKLLLILLFICLAFTSCSSLSSATETAAEITERTQIETEGETNFENSEITVYEIDEKTTDETEPKLPETESVREKTSLPETEPEGVPETLIVTEQEINGQNTVRENSEPLFPEYEHEVTTEYVLNTSSKKIHKPDCSDVKKIKPDNFSTATDLTEYLEKGYTYCKHCW